MLAQWLWGPKASLLVNCHTGSYKGSDLLWAPFEDANPDSWRGPSNFSVTGDLLALRQQLTMFMGWPSITPLYCYHQQQIFTDPLGGCQALC